MPHRNDRCFPLRRTEHFEAKLMRTIFHNASFAINSKTKRMRTIGKLLKFIVLKIFLSFCFVGVREKFDFTAIQNSAERQMTESLRGHCEPWRRKAGPFSWKTVKAPVVICGDKCLETGQVCSLFPGQVDVDCWQAAHSSCNRKQRDSPLSCYVAIIPFAEPQQRVTRCCVKGRQMGSFEIKFDATAVQYGPSVHQAGKCFLMFQNKHFLIS